MAWSVTLSEMLTELRNRGGYRRSTALTDPILTSFLNYAIAEVHDLIVKHNPEFLVKSEDIAPLVGTSTIELPSDFYKLYLAAVVEGSDVRTLKQASLRESLEAPSGGGRYLLHSDDLQPMVSTDEVTVRLFYIPHATRLVAGDDTYNGVNGHEDLVYEHALARCRRRDGQPTDSHQAEIARLEKRLLSALEAMDTAEPVYLEDLGRRREDLY